MSDAFNDAADAARDDLRKSRSLDERIRAVKRNYYEAIRNYLYGAVARNLNLRSAKAVVCRLAKEWDKLAGGQIAAQVPNLLKGLLRQEDQIWSALLCEVADYPDLFDDLARASALSSRGALSVVYTNGNLICLVRGSLRDILEDQIPRNSKPMSRHLFVTSRFSAIERVD